MDLRPPSLAFDLEPIDVGEVDVTQLDANQLHLSPLELSPLKLNPLKLRPQKMIYKTTIGKPRTNNACFFAALNKRLKDSSRVPASLIHEHEQDDGSKQ